MSLRHHLACALLGACAVFGVAALPSGPAQAQSAPAQSDPAQSAQAQSAAPDAVSYAKWFKYGASVEQAWEVYALPDAPGQVFIRRRGVRPSQNGKRVFVLYPRASSAYDVAITKMLGVFADKSLNLAFTILNYANNDERGAQAIEFARRGGFDLIVAMGSESTAWLYENYRGGDIPVVSVCAKDPVELGQMRDYQSGSGTNFAFTSLNMPIEVQLAYLLELKPELRNLGIIVDRKNVSAVQTQAEPMARLAKQRGIRTIEVAVNNPENARAELDAHVDAAVQTMRKNDPFLGNSALWITGSTSVFSEIAAINARADRVPVLSAVPEVVKEGDDSAAVSVGVSFESNAHLAAIYVSEILAGRARPADLKVGIVSPPDIAINFHKVRDIGMRIPFAFFESASFIYDYEGRTVRSNKLVPATN